MSKEIIDKINNNLIMLVEGFDDAERDYGYDMANEKHYVSELIELVKNLSLSGVVDCNCDESKQLEEEFEISHLINDTYQVVGKDSNTVWKQGTMEECNDWVML